jgi:hypothetical protein
MEVYFQREVSPQELEMDGVEVLSQEGRRVELSVSGNVEELVRRLAGLPLEDLAFPEATLEDTFMKFYGREGP